MRNIESQEILIKVDQPLPATRVCKKCQIEKSFDSFVKHKACKYETTHTCKACHDVGVKLWNQKNPQKVKQTKQKWRDNNKDIQKTYRTENKDRIAILKKQWKQQNRHRVNASVRKREIRERLAYVNWANQEKISSIYAMAKFLTTVVGIQYHVDHIIPLQGKNVSGLHVENNLSIVRAKHNLSKGNTYEN